jgi:hypothetical protein
VHVRTPLLRAAAQHSTATLARKRPDTACGVQHSAALSWRGQQQARRM